jgi:hypothetical protein
MSTNLILYRIYCITTDKWVQGYSSLPLTTCPENVLHIINVNSVQIVTPDRTILDQGNYILTSTIDANYIDQGALVISNGGLSVKGNLQTAGQIICNNTSNNSVLVYGGINILKDSVLNGNMNIVGNTICSGTLQITNTTNSTSISTGALQVIGGLGIQGSLYCNSAFFTSNVDIGSNRIMNVGTCVSNKDAANKDYVDSIAQGLSVKLSVKAASTSNIILSTIVPGVIIDGITLQQNNRILLKDQTNNIDNGIYIVQSEGPIRSLDFNTGSNASGTFVFVSLGSVNINSGWVEVDIDNSGLDIIGRDAISFTTFSAAGQIIAGNGIIKTNSSISTDPIQTRVTALGTINIGTWQASSISVQYGGTGTTHFTNGNILFGNGTSLINTSSDFTFDSNTLTISTTIDSTSTSTGVITVGGGIGIKKNIYYGGQLKSTIPTGIPPLTVESTTNVINLNSSSVNGYTFDSPGPIGSIVASNSNFTRVLTDSIGSKNTLTISILSNLNLNNFSITNSKLPINSTDLTNKAYVDIIKQFIGGSAIVNITQGTQQIHDTYCSIYGNISYLTSSSGCELLFGISGFITPIYISTGKPCNVYLVINGEYVILTSTMTTSIGFTSINLISLFANTQSLTDTYVGISWNFRLQQTNDQVPILTLTGNQSINKGDVPSNLVLSGITSPSVIWQISTNDIRFTNLTQNITNSMIYTSTDIGNITMSTSYRVSINMNGYSIYSNHVTISILIPDPMNFGVNCKGFSLFTTTGAIGNTGANTVFNGILGSNDSAITGFDPLETRLHSNDSITNACASSLPSVFNTVRGYVVTSSHGAVYGTGIGETLGPGVYYTAGAGSMAGTLYLDAKGDTYAIFVFHITGAMSIGASSTIILLNNAKAYNVYWLIDAALNVAANSTQVGTFMCSSGAINLGDGCTLNCRYFTLAGAITLTNCILDYTFV